MNYFLVTCLLALSASVNADGLGGYGAPVYAPGHASVDYYAYPRYAYEYSVKDPHTGDNKAQWEKRDGDVVKGAYSLVEPDGSVRVVEYWADDKSGFHAVVKRLGPNLHPTTVHAPIYKAPIPVLGHGPIAPISVGPVANLGHLSSAPLLNSPLSGHNYGIGGAISHANIIREDSPIMKPVPIIKPLPIAPVPIIKNIAPIYDAPIINQYQAPLIKSAYQAPLAKSIYQLPLIKSGPIYPGPIVQPSPLYPAPLSLQKSPLNYNLEGLGLSNLGLGYKGLGPLENLGYLSKSPMLPSWVPEYSLYGKH